MEALHGHGGGVIDPAGQVPAADGRRAARRDVGLRARAEPPRRGKRATPRSLLAALLALLACSAPPAPTRLALPAPREPAPFRPEARARAIDRRLTAELTHADGAPAASARVLLFADGWLVARATTDAAGRALLAADLPASAELYVVADLGAAAARLTESERPHHFTGRLAPGLWLELPEAAPCPLPPEAREVIAELGVSPCLGADVRHALLHESGPLGLRGDGKRVVLRYEDVATPTPTIVLGPRGRLLSLEGGRFPADEAIRLEQQLSARFPAPGRGACRPNPAATDAPPPFRLAADGIALELTHGKDCSLTAAQLWTE